MPAGILCLALSLAIKPHDAGLVWLYFLLAGGVIGNARCKPSSLLLSLVLSAFLWVSHVAPHWMQDWQSNLATISAPGGINEPGPASLTGRSASMVIDLQAAISIFRDDPRIYNPASYLFCGVLLLLWAVRTLRSSFSHGQSLDCAGGNRASYHAGDLSSAMGCEAFDAHHSGLRIVVGRGRPNCADCAAGEFPRGCC